MRQQRGAICGVWRAMLVLMAGLLLPLPALAGLPESRVWFEGMTQADREGVQYDLVLLGHFGYVIDGQFGENTYQAIIAYEQSAGLAPDGVLDEAERRALYEQSDVVYKRFGMQSISDAEGRSSLVLPAGLLSEVTPYNNGHAYATPDGGIVLETLTTPASEMSFSDVFAASNSSQDGLSISTASFSPDRFVVEGTRNGRAFYTLYENVGTESVGYSLSWSEDHAADAAIIKVFIASFFVPLQLTTNPDPDKASTATANVFGVWSLPDTDPRVIALNGDIGASLVDDFERALEARPDAHVLVLNSPGGYVDDALVVARKVRERGMDTVVAKGMGCYSACSYIYFAGANRQVEGELGVHQISSEVADLVLAQTTLADVLAALDEFEVTQSIITVMLQTPPEEMYIFSPGEVASLGINRGARIEVAALPAALPSGNVGEGPVAVPPSGGGTSFVLLAWTDSQAAAERSLKFALDRFAGALGSARPEVSTADAPDRTLYAVRVPAASSENANAICAAVKSAGGGCYVVTE